MVATEASTPYGSSIAMFSERSEDMGSEGC
jgi:hypothetical protein